MTLGEIYNKVQRGDTLTDAELELMVATLPPVVHTLKGLGPTFHLAWKELHLLVVQLTGVQTARKRDKSRS